MQQQILSRQSNDKEYSCFDPRDTFNRSLYVSRSSLGSSCPKSTASLMKNGQCREKPMKQPVVRSSPVVVG